MIDLNHPLAGEKLIYDLKVEEKLADDNSQIGAILDTFNLKADSFKLEGGVLSITFSPSVNKDVDFLINKSTFANSLHELLGGIKKLNITEEYSLEEKEEKEHKA
jgi:FKBP-type peptidyl-prolyl cis-trans isomerase SlyD